MKVWLRTLPLYYKIMLIIDIVAGCVGITAFLLMMPTLFVSAFAIMFALTVAAYILYKIEDVKS